MPIDVRGSTVVVNGVAVAPGANKMVYVVGYRGTTPTATQLVPFDITSTSVATSKFGAGSNAIEVVETLITNGVSRIKGIMTKETGSPSPTKADVYDEALDVLLGENENMCVIVCDETDATVHAKVKTHLDLAEQEDKFRYGVVGTVAAKTNAELVSLASAINHKRMYFAGPSVMDGNSAKSGIIGAAGLAAVIATKTADPALPANGVEILGFTGVERNLLKADKSTLLAGGITALYQSPGGNPAIYRLVSTYTLDSQANPDATWSELTTVMIADDVLSSVRDRILANYKRTKNAARILDSIRTDVVLVLKTKEELEIIENFDETKVVVERDPQDVYGALVRYEIDVVTPLYTVTITQSLRV